MDNLTDATKVQAGLLILYVALSILFFKQRQYPIAIYYVGCLVKDAAVFVLALVNK